METYTINKDTPQWGEWFTDGTPDEWFAEHAKSAAWGGGSGHRDLTDEQKAWIRTLATTPPEGMFWLVNEGGYWHRLWTLGLYDGWVFWRKRVCLGTDGPISGEHVHEGYDLRGIALGEYDPDRKVFPFNGWKIARVLP